MASVPAIRAGLAAQLSNLEDLTVYPKLTGTIVPPAAIVYPEPGDFLRFDATMGRGSDDFTFVVLLLAANADREVAEDELAPYLAGSGDTSIKALIEGGGRLGGACHFARVVQARNYGTTEVGGQEYLSVEFVIEVTA